MRTASPVCSPLACTICLKFLDDSVIAKAYLFCHLPTLPLVCFSAPIPPTPFPSGEGGDYKLILPGAPPPAPRHQTAYGTDSPCRCGTPEGGLPSLSPTTPACSLPFCPLPRRGRIDSPAPIPPPALAERSSRREGGDYKLILPGAPPPAPRHQTVYGTDSPCRCSTPAGGLPSWSPAYPAFSLLFCPPSPKGKDSPLLALAERSSRREGGDYKFILPGLRPLHPGVWTGRGTGSASIGGTPRAACILVAGSPATATPGGVGQTKRGP